MGNRELSPIISTPWIRFMSPSLSTELHPAEGGADTWPRRGSFGEGNDKGGGLGLERTGFTGSVTYNQ